LQGRKKTESGMEKRIRIIWILSLLSALLLIGVQGYWLYNQFRYAVDACSQELAQKALEAGDKEFAIRSQTATKAFYTYVVHQNTANPGQDGNVKQQALFSIVNRDPDEAKRQPHDSTELRMFFNSKMSADSLHAAINRAATNFNNPFRAALLDSLIRAGLPGISYLLADWPEADSLRYASSWKQSGSLFRPAITVLYAYSPFEQKGVAIHIAIPPQPLFKKMAIQLLLALGLILLLTGCLVFQIKTILKQQKLGELREGFVNTMIHELKRPVQTLKTFVSFLGDKDMRADETTANQVAQDSMFELDVLSAYLDKLKDMVRADTLSTPLRPVRFNLEELAGKALRFIHIPAGKQVKLSACYNMESPWIEADPLHIANILSNLVENAVKYSDTSVEVEVTVKQTKRELWLTVTDNGIGVPFAEQEKVFAKFYRGSNLPNRDIPGIGLGLSYVKLIAEAHHGHVSLRSCAGKGTSVTLYLPQ
jgi:two-component system phosphate regulon sensor histidine kinase PhoR